MDLTYCCAGLAGMPAAAPASGRGAAEMVVRFTELVDTALAGGDRLVRVVGGAAVVACGDPGAAVSFVSTLFELAAGAGGLPGLRAGLHASCAVPGGSGADAMALAARLAAEARRGQALATPAVARAAGAAGIEVTKLGEFELHGVAGPVTIFEIDVRGEEGERVEDPVCRIEVERCRAPARLRFAHVEYYFCSLECAGDFAREPGRYAFD